MMLNNEKINNKHNDEIEIIALFIVQQTMTFWQDRKMTQNVTPLSNQTIDSKFSIMQSYEAIFPASFYVHKA